jgi:hypothetical protein
MIVRDAGTVMEAIVTAPMTVEPGGGAGRWRSRNRREPYSEAMTTWEYATVPLLVHATKQILDNWGRDGWELVQVVPGLTPENLVAYLKRPVLDARSAS